MNSEGAEPHYIAGAIGSSPDDLFTMSHSSHTPQLHHKKKRVGKACDSCRIKKTKCDGKKPCNKCIQDNKICVFTEKKKLKEKNYAPGYVELLETRLDLITKAFELMIQLSRPHLSFLDELTESVDQTPDPNEEQEADYDSDNDSDIDSNYKRMDSDEVLVPINKVINYLIANEGLLHNLPMEWENGAHIAANYSRSQYKQASKQFANHKLEFDKRSENDSDSPPKSIRSQKSSTSKPKVKRNSKLSSRDRSQDTFVKMEPDEESFKDEFDENQDLNDVRLRQMDFLNNNLNMDEFPMDNYSSGGFVLANSATLNDGLSNDLSDFESDSNSIYSQSNPPIANRGSNSPNTISGSNSGGTNQPMSPTLEDTNFRPASLFNHESGSGLYTDGNNSTASLTNRLESHNLNTISPTSTFDSGNRTHPSQDELFHGSTMEQPQLLRRSSSNIGRPRSPSHQKLKNLGHIHKPIHNHHPQSHSQTHSQPHSRSNSSNNVLMHTQDPNLEFDMTLPSQSMATTDLNYDNILEDL